MTKPNPRVVVSTGLLMEEFKQLEHALEVCPTGTSAAKLIRMALLFALEIGIDFLNEAGFFTEGLTQETIKRIRSAIMVGMSQSSGTGRQLS